MELVRSNRTEALADALATQVRDQPLAPWEKEVIVVQSRGMERWLSLALTERLGIWASSWFPFPRRLTEWVLENLGRGRAEGADPYEPNRLMWTIAEELRQSPPEELADYVGRGDEERTLRLASQVARVFDDYVVFRPDLLARWSNDRETHWQAELWQRLRKLLGPTDLATRITEATKALESETKSHSLPLTRLHLFSLETLPPLFLQFFTELSRSVQTTMYLLEPSREYVGDVVPKREREALEPGAREGHALLSDIGRLSRDFQQLLLETDGAAGRQVEAFESPGRETLLRSIQSDILEFRSPPEPEARQPARADDHSISVHACTGPMREAHAVHDLVRGALEDDPSLRPEDIVIMTPDLDAYAPVFRAVFGEGKGHRIPFEVHDRRTRDDASFYDDFLAALEVLDSRFSVLDVMRLLDTSSMRNEARFTQEERARLTELLSAAGVRWGIDAAHRREQGFPEEGLHAWQSGLDRLFLGFAAMPDSAAVFEGLLPRGAPSLGDAELIARLSALCGVLFELQQRTRGPLPLDTWADELGRLCVRLFSEDDETSSAVRNVRDALESLRTLAAEGGYTGRVSLETVRRELRRRLVNQTPPAGFLRRGVTVTELVPLRSVPFRVVCLAGMSEDAFPRGDDRPSFDRTRDAHRPGDRNKRDDDRHSFLQALLCARDRLIVTYSAPPGGLRTSANPSPVVSELRESVNDYYASSGGEGLLEPVVHPLHAFDPACFGGGAVPKSFSSRYAEIGRVVSGEPAPMPRLELRAEVKVEDDAQSLGVGELANWLWNPMKQFIDRVLRAQFERSELYEPTGALTELSPLDAAKVGDTALRAGLRSNALLRYLDAAPEFPDGNWGRFRRQRLAREVEAIAAREALAAPRSPVRTEQLELTVGGTLLEGTLDGVTETLRLIKRFTKPGRRAELVVWIEHLMMQAAAGPLPSRTDLVLRGEASTVELVSFEPVDDPHAELEALVEMYQRSQEAPLPLIERASREFAEAFDGGEQTAFRKARDQIKKQRRWDDRIAFILGPDDPFTNRDWGNAFKEATLAVYGPLLKHRRGR
jgi:exodeoxyribonuclease V gamma subunit